LPRELGQSNSGKCSQVYNTNMEATLHQPDRAVKHQRTRMDWATRERLEGRSGQRKQEAFSALNT